ncbi:hypothetical protein CRUP_027376, partial [Coryphaenoides rupestris]
KRLIEEIKMVLRVLVLYIPLPMFWTLFDQQTLNALLILVFVPIFDIIIYPLVALCGVNIGQGTGLTMDLTQPLC